MDVSSLALTGMDAVFLTQPGYWLRHNYPYQIVSNAYRGSGMQDRREGYRTYRHTLVCNSLLNGGISSPSGASWACGRGKSSIGTRDSRKLVCSVVRI
jgi:hypothetical protein